VVEAAISDVVDEDAVTDSCAVLKDSTAQKIGCGTTDHVTFV